MAAGKRYELPELLLDHSLGSITVPALLRAAGLRAHPLAEVYGSPAGDAVEDSAWLHEAGLRGWPVLMRDHRIRYRPATRAAVLAHGVTAFCLTGESLTAAVLAERFLRVLDQVARACARPGPALHLITASGMRSLEP